SKKRKGQLQSPLLHPHDRLVLAASQNKKTLTTSFIRFFIHPSVHTGPDSPVGTLSGRAVGGLIFVLGLGTLLPWNFFMTASQYFNERLTSNVSSNITSDAAPKGYNYDSWMALLSQLPLLLFTLLNSFLYQWVRERLRVAFSLIAIFLLFALTAALVHVQMLPDTFFSVTMATIWFINSEPCWPVGLLTQLTGTGRPKQAAARTVLEAKTRVWEEFGEAMEEDYRSASKRFWQTVRRLRRGKQYSANTVYSAGGELLTSTGDIVGQWKKYFEDLLNPTDLPSSEEAEAGDSEVDSSITQAEVTEVVRKLLGGKAPGVDEIRPEYLKSLDVVGLSWLTCLCNIAWSLPGKVYARVLERRIRPIVDPRIQEEQCGFHPGRGTLDQLYTSLRRVLEGLWEFAQPVHMCFVDLEKAFDRVPRGILWGVLREYGVRGPLLRAVRSLYDRSRSLVRIAGRAGGNHRISSLLFADDVVLLASSSQDLQRVLERFAAECEAAGMRISTSKSEAMVLDRKRVVCPLLVGGEVLPQVEEFKYLGVLFTSEGKMEREIDRRIGAASAVMRSVYRTVVVKKELSRKAKLSIYRSIYVPTLTYVFSAVLQGSLFGVVGLFPPRYSTLFMSGQGLAGMFAAIAMLFSILSNADKTSGVMGYFITPCVATLVTLMCYLLLPHLEFARFYLKRSQTDEVEKTQILLSGAELEVKEKVSKQPGENQERSSVWSVFKKIWLMAACVTCVFAVTLSVFPVITVRVQTVYTESAAWNKVFTCVCCFIVFNIMDFLGRSAPSLVQWPSKDSPLFPAAVLSRLLFIPLLMVCNVHNSKLTVLLKHDCAFVTVMAAFAFSNGYLASLCMAYAPQLVRYKDCETAGSLMTFFLVLGLALGASFSFLLGKLV
ncbi:hypothetical protein L3Q82_020093, partial [Scortum barcoo]